MDLQGLSGNDLDSAVERLKAILTHKARKSRLMLITPGASNLMLDAYWHDAEGFWVTFYHEASGRYLISYGLVDPDKETNQGFVCQINVQPAEPWTRMGAFASDGHRGIYYLHTGRIARYTTFAQRYQGQKATVRWPGHPSATYLVVTNLSDRNAVSQVAGYIKAIARYRGGGTLEDEYRGAFEEGVAEAIRDLEGRLGGADAVAKPQAVPPSGQLQAGGAVGPFDHVRAARARLDFLKQLDEKLRYDPYLLYMPVDKITASVQADRRRRFIYSIAASVLSIAAGWLLSAVNPSSLESALQGFYGALASVLPFFPH